jgi:hypothetical protein
MMNDREEQLGAAQPPQADPGAYESPKIERILTPDDMEREVMFAGPAVTIGDLPTPG